MTEGTTMVKVIMVNGKEYQFITPDPEEFISQFYHPSEDRIMEKFIQAQSYQGKQVHLNTRQISSIEYSLR